MAAKKPLGRKRRGLRNNKRKTTGRPWWKLWWAAVVLLLFWNIAGPYGYWKLHRLNEERERAYAQYAKVLKDNETLRQYVAAFETDPAFQERVVRKELGWVRDDELLYRFID